jgi:hypothetical protein
LAVVPDTAPASVPSVWFCSHCGSNEDTADDTPPSRVCGDCGLGVLLETRADIAPQRDSVHRHVTQLLVPADAEASGPSNLASAVAWAANGDDGSHTVTVRPATTFGIRLSARIAHCSPPSGALLVFD